MLPINHFSLLTLLLGLMFMASCQPNKEEKKKEKLLIVTTTGMIRDAVENIAGDSVDVIALMGPGVDPHLYKATKGDLDKLQDADIIFYNGLHLEGKMTEVLEKLSKQKPVIPIAASIDPGKLRKLGENTYDPHIWFDVTLWKEAIEQIAITLYDKDTLNKEMYRKNYEAYALRLDSLDKWVTEEIQSIPKEQRILVTAHDAFGYFGIAYDIEVVGLQGVSTLSEFGLKDITDLVNLITRHKIKAVFVETSVSQKSIEAVVQGAKAKGHNVMIGGSLYSDAMGEEGTPEGNYIGMIKSNVTTIVNSLK